MPVRQHRRAVRPEGARGRRGSRPSSSSTSTRRSAASTSTPTRSPRAPPATPRRSRNAYRTGLLNEFSNTSEVAMINHGGPDPGLAHDYAHAVWSHLRLQRSQGHTDNRVEWFGPTPLLGDVRWPTEAFVAMDGWLAKVEKDTRTRAAGDEDRRGQAGVAHRPLPRRRRARRRVPRRPRAAPTCRRRARRRAVRRPTTCWPAGPSRSTGRRTSCRAGCPSRSPTRSGRGSRRSSRPASASGRCPASARARRETWLGYGTATKVDVRRRGARPRARRLRPRVVRAVLPSVVAVVSRSR